MSEESIQKTAFAVLTKKEAAEILKVSPRTVDYLVITNQIPFSRIGKRAVRFSENRLREWFEDQQEGIPFHRKVKADI
jgi:excisionase family DNA binding protein